MKTRIFTFLGLFAIGLVGINPLAHAQVLQLVRSIPAASAVLGSHSHGFYVRFNRPVDHIRSQLSITENGKVFATLLCLQIPQLPRKIGGLIFCPAPRRAQYPREGLGTSCRMQILARPQSEMSNSSAIFCIGFDHTRSKSSRRVNIRMPRSITPLCHAAQHLPATHSGIDWALVESNGFYGQKSALKARALPTSAPHSTPIAVQEKCCISH
jgi:hypothetical protein